jgi:uncharacterized membrane protein YbaN (DUF454 family)
MELDPSEGGVLQEQLERGQVDAAFPCLEIEFDETAESVRIYDPRLFQAKRRSFCERLLKAASRQPGISKAEVDLGSASCQIEFCHGSQTPRSMADSFVRAVREASSGPALLDRVCWWRHRGRWSAWTAFRLPEGISLWETFEIEPAQIRMCRAGVEGNRARLSRVADTVADLEGVDACRVSPWSHCITIDVALDSPVADRFLDTVEQALACLKAADLLGPERPATAPFVPANGDVAVVTATGVRRLRYMTLAGGAFSMTLVGLVVPGIPTVPFLLATSFYLARSSPSMNERLRRTAFFGPILREWEGQGALSLTSKGKLITLSGMIVIVTVVLAPLTPIALCVILAISSLSVYGVSRIPALTSDLWASARAEMGITVPILTRSARPITDAAVPG